MTQTFLKMGFYVMVGTILAAISWSSIKHSIVTRDYILGIIVMGMMFFIIGKFFVDRWRPVLGSKDFHPSRPWKIPYMTTPGGIWLRVGFITVVSICVFAVLASILVLGTTAQTPFMALLGSLLVLRIPHLYWSMRGRYEVMQTENAVGTIQSVLRYRGGSELHGRAFWLIPTLMAVLGALVATVGVLLH